jgi:trans-aconitate methyltransferase
MGVATHLGIDLAEYDARIRTFIPDYEAMLDAASAAVPMRARMIVDLGTGTGALAARCLARAASARIVAIDADRDILAVARRRLGARATFVCSTFARANLPRCDAVVASFAVHHVRTRLAKASLYHRIAAALRPRGLLIVVDCQPAADASLARAQFGAWRAHLRRSYTAREATAFLRAWGKEDVYVPLDDELALIRGSGLAVDVLWRKGAFAVLVARKRSR